MIKPTSKEAAERLIILKCLYDWAMANPPNDHFESVYKNLSRTDRIIFTEDCKRQSDSIIQNLKSIGVWKNLTKDERNFMRSVPPNIDPQYQINASWGIESAVVIMWSLSLIEEFPPFDCMSNGDFLKKIPSNNLSDFIEKVSLRADEDIEKYRSLAQSWHWRSRTRELVEMGRVPNPKLGYKSYDEIVNKRAESLNNAGDIPPLINNDFPAKGKAYRDLDKDEWSEVRSITMERHHALNWLCGYAPDNQWDKTPTDT